MGAWRSQDAAFLEGSKDRGGFLSTKIAKRRNAFLASFPANAINREKMSRVADQRPTKDVENRVSDRP